MKSILLAELPSKLQAAMLLPDREREHELYEIAGLISANDYANAIAVANGTLTIYGDQQIFMRAVLQAWARSNPRTASEYVLTLPANGVRDEILKLTIGSWASQDPLAAIQFANALPTGSGRDWALCFAASAWSQADAPAAWKWATSLPEGEARVLAIQATLQMLSERSPDDAANYAAQLSGAELVRAVRALIQNTSISNPSWTADWVKDFPPSEARNQAVEMLVKRWAEKDPISASDWLLKQPQDQGFQDAIKHICSKALKVSPALAWDWAMRIGDEKARKLSTQTVAHHWLGLDVQAARAKIQASGLPAEQISKLLEQSQ